MAAFLSWSLILIGAFFMLVAGVGVFRMPDVFMRLHSSTKSATLGVGCVMLGVALHFNEISIGARALAVVLFAFVTAPVSAHMIGRAAYFSGVPLWSGTLSDDLRGKYQKDTHVLVSESNPEDAPAEPAPPG